MDAQIIAFPAWRRIDPSEFKCRHEQLGYHCHVKDCPVKPEALHAHRTTPM